MLKLKFILLLLAIGQLLYSQRHKNFSFQIQVGPQISYKAFQPLYDFSSELITQNEKPRLSLSAGLLTNYSISNKLDFVSGIVYSGKGYKVISHFSDDIISLNPIPEKIEALFKFHFFDFPFLIKYSYKGWDRTRLSIQTGIGINLLMDVTSKHYEYYESGQVETIKYIEDLTDQRKLNCSYNMGFGLKYAVTERMNFELVTFFDYMILNHHTDHNKMNLWEVGEVIRVGYKF